MSKDVKSMSRAELEAEVLRLRDKMRDEALRLAREIKERRVDLAGKPSESEKGLSR